MTDETDPSHTTGGHASRGRRSRDGAQVPFHAKHSWARVCTFPPCSECAPAQSLCPVVVLSAALAADWRARRYRQQNSGTGYRKNKQDGLLFAMGTMILLVSLFSV